MNTMNFSHRLGWYFLAFLLPFTTAQTALAAKITEREDAVIIAGQQFGGFAGKPKTSYRLMTIQNNYFEAIPFQIDEKNQKDEWCLEFGFRPVVDEDANFDANDELVFMAHDLGPQKAQPELPAGCEAVSEISVKDAETQDAGFAYLFSCSNPPKLSMQDYVSISATDWTVYSTTYQFGWRQKQGFSYDYIVLNPKEKSPDILDRLELRIITGKFGLNLTFDEDDLKFHFRGAIDGPVRIVYLADNELNLSILGTIPLRQQLFFYGKWVRLFNTMDTTFNPAMFGLDMLVTINHDLALDRSRGYKIFVDEYPEGRTLRGQMTAEEKDTAGHNRPWGAIVGPEGAIATRLVLDPDLPCQQLGVFVDDDKFFPKPEYIPGSAPLMGFKIADWKKAKLGTYDLDFYHFFMNPYSAEKRLQFDKLIFKPLKVEINP